MGRNVQITDEDTRVDYELEIKSTCDAPVCLAFNCHFWKHIAQLATQCSGARLRNTSNDASSPEVWFSRVGGRCCRKHRHHSTMSISAQHEAWRIFVLHVFSAKRSADFSQKLVKQTSSEFCTLLCEYNEAQAPNSRAGWGRNRTRTFPAAKRRAFDKLVRAIPSYQWRLCFVLSLFFAEAFRKEEKEV